MRYRPGVPNVATGVLIMLLAAATWLAAVELAAGRPAASLPEQQAAVRAMARATDVIRAWRRAHHLGVDRAADPNATGWIGLAGSPITTEEGSLAAKRTTTNPALAAAVVDILVSAGVRRGDVVAMGMSGSFPALNAASIIAVEHVGATPVPISSIGSSQWGANDVRFTWPDMESALFDAGVLHHRSAAVALGGSTMGLSLPRSSQQLLRRVAARNRLKPIEEDGRVDLVARMRIYRDQAGTRPVRLFLNVGGALANIGPHDVLPFGLLLPDNDDHLPPRAGVAGAMLRRGVPVINLRYISHLCRTYHLPWDPRPLPAPAGQPLPGDRRLPTWLAGALFAFLATGGALLLVRDARARSAQQSALDDWSEAPAPTYNSEEC